MIYLMKGDCLELMGEIPAGSIDLVLADPPYGMTACPWDSVIPLDQLWEQIERVIKPSGAIVLNSMQPFTTKLISSNEKIFKYCWYWNKKLTTGFLNAKKQPLRSMEDICVFYKKQCTYHPRMTAGIMRKKGGENRMGEAYGEFKDLSSVNDQYYPKNYIEFGNTNTKHKKHPTQKPVALMEYMIETYTNQGETVLDFCMGSGTTGVAAENTGRNFIGIEKEQKYFNIARQRIDDAGSQLRLFNEA